MALKKAITTPIGVDALYWRIGRLDYHRRTGIHYVTLDGFKDRDTRYTDGSQPLARREFQFTDLGDVSTEAIYAAIMARQTAARDLDLDGEKIIDPGAPASEFYGAEDV